MSRSRWSLPSPRLEHLVFAATLVVLVALAAWWGVLATRFVEAEHAGARSALMVEATRAASTPGELLDPRLERVEAAGLADLATRGSQGVVRVRPEVVTELEARKASRYRMVAGEGGLMMLLVGLCVVMLYRLVLAQAAFRDEMFEFVGQVTHEMKTPLAGLRALLETIRLGRLAGPDLGEAVELGLRQVEHEERLVQNLLLAQRVRSSDPRLDRCAIAIDDFLLRFRAGRVEATLGGAELVLDVVGGPIAVADEGALWNILDNLVDNAMKYGASTVTLCARVEGDDVVLACIDDGDGFDPVLGDTLFEPGRRVRASGQPSRSGTGLGLWIGRSLARAMDGDLVAASEGPGKGATFTLTLPAVTSPVAELAAEVAT